MLVGEITDDEKKKADEEIREQQKQIDYDTKDYTIELLVQKIEKNDFFIPDYQRALMRGNSNKNLFLESVLLGLPISLMFLLIAKTESRKLFMAHRGYRR